MSENSHPVTKKLKKKTPIHTNCVRKSVEEKVKKIMDSEKSSNFILFENRNKTKNILLQTEAIMYAEIKMTLFSIIILLAKFTLLNI